MRPTRDRDRSILARLVSAVTSDSGPGTLPSRSRMHSAYRSIGTSCTASFQSTTVRMIPASSPPLTHLHRAGQGPPLEHVPASLQVDPASQPLRPSRYGCVHPPSHRFSASAAKPSTIQRQYLDQTFLWISIDLRRMRNIARLLRWCSCTPLAHQHRAGESCGGGLSSSRASLPHYAGYGIAMAPDLGFGKVRADYYAWHRNCHVDREL